MRRCLFVVLLFLGGCGVLVPIDYSTPPPADWPNLRQEVYYGTRDVVEQWCEDSSIVAGCARVYFHKNLCVIYLHSKDPSYLEHERAHCRGYNHVGDAKITHQLWEEYKKSRR